MPVYFIQAGDSGPVKIGRATNVARRLLVLQTSHYEPLRLLRTIDGGVRVEAWLHKHFRPGHIRGEWFVFAEEMLAVEPPDEVVPPDPEWARDGRLLSPSEMKRLAAESGLTMKALCDRAGVSHTTVSRWRAGKNTPTLSAYQRIHDVLAAVQEAAA